MALLSLREGVGVYDIPGIGRINPGETKEITFKAALWAKDHPNFFNVTLTDEDEFSYKVNGKVKYLDFMGEVGNNFGYGRASIQILEALKLLNIEVKKCMRFSGMSKDFTPEDIKAYLTKPLNVDPKVCLAHTTPGNYEGSNALIKIIWTMWETDRMPGTHCLTDSVSGKIWKQSFGSVEWVDRLNDSWQHIIVPCDDNKRIFEERGVTTPITVIPYGFDEKAFPYKERKVKEDGRFTLFQYAAMGDRKGVTEAMEAFTLAFPKKKFPLAKFVMKTHAHAFSHGDARSFGLHPVTNDTRITLIDEMWTNEKLLETLYEADAFIWLSKGEGCGLPPIEATLTGCPVITSQNSGMLTYLAHESFYKVDFAYEEVSSLGGNWWVSSPESAAKQLKKIYNNREEAKARAFEAQKWIRETFTFEKFTSNIYKLLDTFN